MTTYADQREQEAPDTRRVTVAAGHPGHELVRVSGRRDSGEMVGLLLCMTCSRIVRELQLCRAKTQRGTPCRAFIRDDLGHTTCWSHGEGAGATSTPRGRS